MKNLTYRLFYFTFLISVLSFTMLDNNPEKGKIKTNPPTAKQALQAAFHESDCSNTDLGAILDHIAAPHSSESIKTSQKNTIKSVTKVTALPRRMPVTECQRVGSCAADAEQLVNGNSFVGCNNTSISDLDLETRGGVINRVGLNFMGWNIPVGATIISARIQFTALRDNRGASSLTIAGEAADNPGVFTTANDVNSRPITSATANWSPPDWSAEDAGVAQQTPDISAIIQEIIDRPGYAQGNNIGIHFGGSGSRGAYSYDLDPSKAPELCITYEIEEPEPIECDGCSDLSITSLQGIPNFPQVDVLNVCSTPDTVSLLIYNPGPCPISNVEISVPFDEGLTYSGFVESYYPDAMVSEFDVSDATEPVFLVNSIDTGGVVIVNFGIAGDCNVDVESEEPLNFDVMVDYFSNTSSNGLLQCSASLEEIGEFNSGIKVPVINLLSITPAELDLSNFSSEFCQTLTISQDGIDANLDHVQIHVDNLELMSTIMLNGINVNGNALPNGSWTYDDPSNMLTLYIDNTYFSQNGHSSGGLGNGNNLFEENERLFVEFCYQAMGCVDPTQFLTYKAFYGCNNQTCFDVSTMQATLDSEASFTANVVANATFNQAGQICGNDFLFDFIITSSNPHPQEGKWKNLIVKFNACNTSFSQITDIALNGTPLPGSLWSESNGAVTINFAGNTQTFGSLSDDDGDGNINDMLGGNALVFNVTMDILCSEDPSCASSQCSIENIEVSGTRNCGQAFQEFAPLASPVTYGYGETSFMTYDTIEAHNNYYENTWVTVPCGEWGPSPNGFKLEFTTGATNIAACTNANMYARVTLDDGSIDYWHDIRYHANSATYNGTPVPGITFDYVTDQFGDTIQIDFIIPMGNPNVTDHAYFFNIEASGHCRPDRHIRAIWEVVQECPDCNGGDCEILMSCHSPLSRIYWNSTNCVCDCDFATHTTHKRLNYGYADCNMTIPLSEGDIPPQDLDRFMPGDIIEITGTAEILDVTALREGSTQWSFYLEGPNVNSDGSWDNHNAVFDNLYFEKAGSGVRQPLIPTCILNEYPANSQLHEDSPNREFKVYLGNLGVSHVNPTADPACTDFSNASPTYPFDQAAPDGYLYSDGSTGHAAYQSYTGAEYYSQNHGNDYYDSRMELHIQFGNNLACDGATYNEDADACANGLVDAFNMENGDSIHFVVRVPIAANGFHKMDSTLHKNDRSLLYIQTYDQRETNCGNVNEIARTCWTDTPYEFYNPEVGHTTEVTVRDCDIEVEHTIFIANPLPTVTAGQVPWYENEYRGAMGVEWIEPFFPSNMVYQDDMVIEDMNGVQTLIGNEWIDASKGNLACSDNGAGGVCCVAADASDYARLHIFDQAYIDGKAHTDCSPYIAYNKPLINHHLDPFPVLPVSGAEDCFYKIKYTLTALCPEDVQSSDFGLNGQFAHVYVPDWIAYNRITNSIADPNSGHYTDLGMNPFGQSNIGRDWDGGIKGWNFYWPWATDPDLYADHASRFVTSEVTTPDNFNDFSTDYPALSANFDRLLIADEAGVNEVNVFELCAGAGGGLSTHENVAATINIPLSIELIDVQSLSGTGINYIFVETTPTHNVYMMEMRDLAPGACDQIEITTELTFCPTGTGADTRIVVEANTGCVDPTKGSDLLADIDACNSVEQAYEYIREESDLQVEWDPNASGEYSLCEQIPMGVRIKNVKPATLTDIEMMWYFPTGLDFVPGTWEVCYPGGPTNTGPCVPIPDPIVDLSMNNALGTFFEYDDSAVWSTFISSNGLPGIAAPNDENRIQFNFLAETECDEFVSGTSIWYQANAADPCEGRVQSMQVQSNPVIIQNANPINFAQFYVFAEPTVAYCGSESNIVLTFLNISPLGETMGSEVCMDIQTGAFDYSPGSATWISPNHIPTITETTSGAAIKICMDVPDGISNGEVFQVGLDFIVPDDVDCGDQTMNVAVQSTIEDQACVSTGVNCSVNVLNSVNPLIDIDFNPPLPISGQNVYVGCSSGDIVPICYDVDVANISPDLYADNIIISIFRDLDSNGELDNYDPQLGSSTMPVVLPGGSNRTLNGCFNVPATDACPVFLIVEQSGPCVCDTKMYYHNVVEPEALAVLPENVNVCPGEALVLENCDDWTYSIQPTNAGTITDAGNGTTELTINSGFGLSTPIMLQATSDLGNCGVQTFSRDVFSLANFNLGPYAPEEVCETDCLQLDLDIDASYRDNMTVVWSPTTFLDDPNSQTPTVCQPTMSINYTVTATYSDGIDNCMFTATFPVQSIPQPIEDVIPDGKLCSAAEYTFTAPTGFDTYEWIFIDNNNQETTVQVGASNVFMESDIMNVGTYYVLYSNSSDACKTRSNNFELEVCIDYGDLPDNSGNTTTGDYQTEVANNGPAHHVEEGFYLGSGVDEEMDGQPNITATGDGNDEDGITFPMDIQWIPGGTIRIPFDVSNPSGQQGELEIWIDWNGDGDFDDPDEFAVDISDNGFGDFGRNGYLTIYVPMDIALDQDLGFRARLSHENDMTPYGTTLEGGEVEDYLLRIDCDNNTCLPVSIEANR